MKRVIDLPKPPSPSKRPKRKSKLLNHMTPHLFHCRSGDHVFTVRTHAKLCDEPLRIPLQADSEDDEPDPPKSNFFLAVWYNARLGSTLTFQTPTPTQRSVAITMEWHFFPTIHQASCWLSAMVDVVGRFFPFATSLKCSVKECVSERFNYVQLLERAREVEREKREACISLFGDGGDDDPNIKSDALDCAYSEQLEAAIWRAEILESVGFSFEKGTLCEIVDNAKTQFATLSPGILEKFHSKHLFDSSDLECEGDLAEVAPPSSEIGLDVVQEAALPVALATQVTATQVTATAQSESTKITPLAKALNFQLPGGNRAARGKKKSR